MANLSLQTVEPPWAGMQTVGTPGQLPKGRAPYVRNFLVHYPGKLVCRSGITGEPYGSIDCESITGESKAIIAQAWQFNDKLLVSFHKNVADEKEGYIPPWKAPYWKASEQKKLAKSQKKLAYVDLTKGTAEEIKIEEEHKAPGSNSARLGNYVYGFAYDGATASLLNGGYMNQCPLLRWDGTKSAPVIQTKAPVGGQAVASHLNRLWTLGGAFTSVYSGEAKTFNNSGYGVGQITDATVWEAVQIGDIVTGEGIPENTTVAAKFGFLAYEVWLSKEVTPKEKVTLTFTSPAEISNSKLYYSIEFGPKTDAEVSWKDEVSGLVNQIIVGDDDQNDFGVALAVINQALIIFKRHSIWALYGYSRSTFQVRNITKERGCVDPASVREVDGGAYFVSQKGLEFFDGSQFRTIDDPIHNVIDYNLPGTVGEQNEAAAKSTWGRISVAPIENDYLMFSCTRQQLFTAGEGKGTAGQSFTGYVHAPTGNWSVFSSDVLKGAKIALFAGQTSTIPWLWDGRYITPIGGIMRDIGTKADTAHETKLVPASFRSDRIELSSPAYKAQPQRFLMDYLTNIEVVAGSGLRTKLLGTSGSTVMAEQHITNVGTSGSPLFEALALGAGGRPAGARFEFDDFNEATDLHWIVEFRDQTSQIPTWLEIYNATIEFQTTRQRRSE